MSNDRKLFEQRKRTKETAPIGDHYVCGCGCEFWILCKNGDCVCAMCMTAQARIIVKELAPVTKRV